MAKKIPRKNERPDVDNLGRTELHYAALERDLLEVQRLLASGVDPNSKDDNGFTPLHFSAQSNCVSVSAALLSAGAEVDPVDVDGNSPLSNAIFNSTGDGTLISLLVAAGADPNLTNIHGVSPLDLAGTIAKYDLSKFLEISRDRLPRE